MNDALVCVGLMLAGILFFSSLYETFRHFLTRCMCHKLQNGDIYFISEKFTCSVQAVLSVASGVVIVSNVNNIMTDIHWLTNSYACFALPYFIHDTRAMFLTFISNHKKSICHNLPLTKKLLLFVKHTPLLIVHHVVMPAIIFPVLIFFRANRGDFFVGTFYLIEVAVPFICLRAVLAQLNMKKSTCYLVSGLLMLTTFFIARILVFPYLYWSYAKHAGIHLVDVPGSIPLKCNLGCLMIFLPQVYWFMCMVQGTIKHFFNKRSQAVCKNQ